MKNEVMVLRTNGKEIVYNTFTNDLKQVYIFVRGDMSEIENFLLPIERGWIHRFQNDGIRDVVFSCGGSKDDTPSFIMRVPLNKLIRAFECSKNTRCKAHEMHNKVTRHRCVVVKVSTIKLYCGVRV